MKKITIYQIQGLYRDDFRVTGYEFGEGEKSVCIVGSMRGNEIQQLYCCSQIVKALKQMEAEEKLLAGHRILVIPCVNPYSINIQKRFWPVDNTDINRMFPGYDLGETTQRIADGVFREISEYRFGIQFTSFYMPGEFIPHVRMMDSGLEDAELAKQFGMPYVVLRRVKPYETTTLNYNWQIWETQAFSMYTAATTRMDKKSAEAAIGGIFTFLQKQGILEYQGREGCLSRVVKDVDMVTVRGKKPGLFEPLVKVGDEVEQGQKLARILDAAEGEVIEELVSPVKGILFFMHGEPLIYANTAVCKVVAREE